MRHRILVTDEAAGAYDAAVNQPITFKIRTSLLYSRAELPFPPGGIITATTERNGKIYKHRVRVQHGGNIYIEPVPSNDVLVTFEWRPGTPPPQDPVLFFGHGVNPAVNVLRAQMRAPMRAPMRAMPRAEVQAALDRLQEQIARLNPPPGAIDVTAFGDTQRQWLVPGLPQAERLDDEPPVN